MFVTLSEEVVTWFVTLFRDSTEVIPMAPTLCSDSNYKNLYRTLHIISCKIVTLFAKMPPF